MIHANRSLAFASRFFKLEKKAPLSESGWLASDIRYFDGRISGYIMNCFPFALENTALITYGQTLPIGRLEAGEVREFENVPLLTWPVDMAYLLADHLTGGADTEENQSRQSCRRRSAPMSIPSILTVILGSTHRISAFPASGRPEGRTRRCCREGKRWTA